MAIICPLCSHGMTVKDAKPGKYKPKCAKCGQRFALTVFADEKQAPLVEKLVVEDVAATVLPAVEKTQADPAATMAGSAMAQRPTTAQQPATVPQPASAAKPSPMAAAARTVAPGLEATIAPVASKPPAGPSPHAAAARTVAPGLEATIAPTASKPPSSAPANPDATLPHDPNSTGAWAPPSSGQGTLPQRAMAATAMGTSAASTKMNTAPGGSGGQGVGGLDIPDRVGGYKIVKELGRGAMGAVYLAKQLSLDRDVALKTIQAKWADNPTFIARFTREAYAAAQLTHHNVVQIYDLGQEGETNFFSMEFVRGESLDEIVKKQGHLDPEVAVGYILQAARGLQYAHNHGMVHRDVKPANLMLSDLGVVKVADLGLVKTPQSTDAEAAAEAADAAGGARQSALGTATADMTIANVAMGTPAYMAPEQSTNAAGVDHRADIYSLGCSLYVLLTGKPPFAGATAMEVMSKHKTEPIVRPEAIVKRVPARLSEITLKMVAKRPEDRYANLGELIKDLEQFLGIQSTGPYSPKEEDARLLEESVGQFNGAALAKIRGLAPTGFAAVCAMVFVVAGALGYIGLAGGVLGLAILTTVMYFILGGVRDRTYLFDKVRQYLSSARISDWLTWIGGGLVFLLALYLFGMLWYWVGFAVLAAGLAAAYYFLIDAGLAKQRQEPLAKMEQLLKSLRLKGVEESSLRHFVAKYSGETWEEFFECLFGYEAKLNAREQFGRGDSGKQRSKFRAWRDGLIRGLEGRLKAAKEAKDRQHLQKVEEKGLQAQGLDLIQARKQAARMADALLDEAAEARSSAGKSAAANDPAAIAAAKRARQKKMLAEARSGDYKSKRPLLGLAASPLALLLGGKVRFLVGCLLIAGCGMWVKQNDLLDVSKMKEATVSAVKTGNLSGVEKVASESARETAKAGVSPLPIPFVGNLVSSWYAGLAGLTLVVLGLFSGWRMSLFAIPAAALMLLGSSLGIPGGPLAGAGIGLVVAVVGYFFGRTPE